MLKHRIALMNKPKVFCFLLFLAVIAGCNPTPPIPPPPPTNSTLTVYFIDVGQGDSIIIRYGNSSMLIDAGTNASTNALVNTIKGLGISKFDIVIGTHPHDDHMGGMDAVINKFNIGKIYMPKISSNTKTFTDVLNAIKNKKLPVTTPVPEEVFNLGDVHCTILAPNSPYYEDLNNYSIVFKMAYGNHSFIFMADAEATIEQEMLVNGYDLKADVLKVGHHGSSDSSTPEFLKAVSPTYAVISVGKRNDYGHPHQVTLDKLLSAGVRIRRTDIDGTVTITSDGSALTASTER
jgi:competence protein ComEC